MTSQLDLDGKSLHHDIDKLQDRYCEIYPELKEAFHTETPWDVGLQRAEKGVRCPLHLSENRS